MTVFSKVDLLKAYHLVRIRKGAKWNTAFNTHLDPFEYLVMLFGLTNVPGVRKFLQTLYQRFQQDNSTTNLSYLSQVSRPVDSLSCRRLQSLKERFASAPIVI